MSKGKTLGGLAVAGLVAWAVASAQPRPQRPRAIAALPPAPQEEPPAVPPRAPRFRRRFASSLAFCLIFFAGAALAAGAGNELTSSSPVAVVTDDVAPAAAPTTVDAGTTTADTTDTTDTTATTDAATTVEATTTTTTAAETTTDELPTTTEELPATTATTDTTFVDPADATPAPAPETTDAAPTPSPSPAPVAAPPAATRAATTPAPQPAHRAQRRVAAPPAPAVSPFPVVPFDPQAWLTDHPASPAGNAAVAIAEHYLGVPYRWGGNTPSTGFDCSGLTQFVYAQLGIWLPHYAAAQFLAYQRLDPSELEPGDLVFFEPKADGPGHVAIYAGDGQIVEAPHTGATVRIGSLAGAAASLGYLGAVRPSQAATFAAPVAAAAPQRAVEGRFIAA